MSEIHLRIDQLRLALHGVSEDMARGLGEALGPAIQARLERADAPVLGVAHADFAELALGPIEARPGLDASALAGLVAERLLDALGARRDAAGGVKA